MGVGLHAPAREREITALVLDHVPHDGDHAQGASRKRDEADVMWALRCPVPFDRDTVGRLTLRRDKDREAWLPERVGFSVGGARSGFVFRRSDGTIEEPNPEDGLTGCERRTFDALRYDFGARERLPPSGSGQPGNRGISEPSFWRAKRAITPPKKEGLVIAGDDSRFRAVPPPGRRSVIVENPEIKRNRATITDYQSTITIAVIALNYHDYHHPLGVIVVIVVSLAEKPRSRGTLAPLVAAVLRKWRRRTVEVSFPALIRWRGPVTHQLIILTSSVLEALGVRWSNLDPGERAQWERVVAL